MSPDLDDDDMLDHGDGPLVSDEDADDDETAELRALFPDGNPSDKWDGVFDGS
jgi:hypothetical protein